MQLGQSCVLKLRTYLRQNVRYNPSRWKQFQQKVMIHRGQATPAVSGPTQLQDGGQRADSIGRNRPWLEG